VRVITIIRKLSLICLNIIVMTSFLVRLLALRSIIAVIQSRRVRWGGRHSYRKLVGKTRSTDGRIILNE
jgi:hypothetical protein